MDNYLVSAAFVALIFAIAKFAEAKWVKKEKLDGAPLVRETVIVYLSAIAGLYAMDKLQVATHTPTGAFTSNPDF
tara:strand:- start:622 stop:846 length:225 start_codon:yes stop_codon:yes gene_type:complete